MPKDSPATQLGSLGERLNQKLEQDLDAAVALTQSKLDKLAESSSKRLRESLNTELTAIEQKLQSLKWYTSKTWLFLVLGSAALTLGMLIGLGMYGHWQLEQLKQIERKRQSIETSLQKLPPPFQVRESQGKWYLTAPQINYTPLTYTNGKGQKEDAIQLTN